jgi:cell division protein FtsZ
MTEAGTTAVMGIGIASGEERAEEAVEQAISCPLLEDVDLSNARGVLVHIVAGMDFAWDEYETVGDALREFASEDSQIIIGVTVDPTIDTADLHVTVIVTGLGERKSDLTVVKNPTAKVEPVVEDVVETAQDIIETEVVVEEPVAEVAKPEGSYLDIPAFLRKQAD